MVQIIKAQESFDDEIVVDNFAGGGGASTGIELALGRIVNIAINHDPAAILLHKTNHPYTEHLQASVWDVDPAEVCRGRKVGLAWFSPDCKHFSKAKGAALVDRKIRGLAWIALRWAGTVRPRVIFLENVEEFQTWGPVRKGKPVKSKAGQTFQKFIHQLTDLGYAVDYRELVAADYGAPTTRKRFVLIARCDGKLIVWPERTHAPQDSEEVRAGKLKPWRSAAEIIDWSLPCPSIFASKQEIKKQFGVNAVRPLAANTMRRIIRGVDKFTIKSGDPFIVEVNHTSYRTDYNCYRGGSVDDPMRTVTASLGRGVCDPVLAPITISNTGSSVGGGADQPVHTVRTGGGGQLLVTPNLVHCKFDNSPENIADPLRTVTSVNAHLLAAPSLIQYHTEKKNEYVRGQSVDKAINTVDASGRYGLASAHLTEYYGNADAGADAAEPMHTATSHDRQGLVSAQLTEFRKQSVGSNLKQPTGAITSHDHEGVMLAHVVKFKGTNLGQSAAEPMQTETAGGGQFAVCKTHLCKIQPGENFGHWSEIRDLLNQYCGYQLADDEILLLEIGMSLYYIADIGLRMLTPRELYNAMGFPTDYIIDTDYTGKPYPKTQQVARCGNAVCPPMAAAVVRANFPEYVPKQVIVTMADLMNRVAV